MKTLFLLTFITLASTCHQTAGLATFENAEGKIKVFVCTRGCYQYLLEHKGVFYFPDQLPDELKVDGQAVFFSGELQSESTMVKKPAPNDVPVDDFRAKNIKILSIEEG